DPWLAALPCQQRTQQRLSVDGIGLGAPLATRDSDGRGLDNGAVNVMAHKQPVYPKALETRLLNANNLDCSSAALLGFASRAREAHHRHHPRRCAWTSCRYQERATSRARSSG